MNSFHSQKTSVQVSAVSKLTVLNCVLLLIQENFLINLPISLLFAEFYFLFASDLQSACQNFKQTCMPDASFLGKREG